MKRHRLGWFWPLAALVLLAALAVCRGTSPTRVEPDTPHVGWLRVDFIDVGHGDATLITSPTGKTVLVDGGKREAGHAVVEHLQQRQVGPLDLILVSHRHEDHIGGLAEVITRAGARQFLDAPSEHDSHVYRKLLETLQARHVPVRLAAHDRRVDLDGGAQLTLLGPPDPPLLNARSEENANSVVSRLDYGRFSVLLAGDAETETEAWLLSSRARLAAAVLKVGHHGSQSSSSVPFLDAVRPRLAVISSDAEDAEKSGHKKVLHRLEGRGIRVLRTDVEGTISIETDGSTIEVRTRNGKETL
jgi:beta-lactamase superfamily II metal-dependent hydrolase